jgi:hypothetical protein
MDAVIVKEETRDGDLWLHMKNRPLDEDYRPQLPPSADDPEGGWYWVVVGNHQTFPSSHHHWADMTVVGRVTVLARDKKPILKMVYVRGWGIVSAHDGVWEHGVTETYAPTTPGGIIVNQTDINRVRNG